MPCCDFVSEVCILRRGGLAKLLRTSTEILFIKTAVTIVFTVPWFGLALKDLDPSEQFGGASSE